MPLKRYPEEFTPSSIVSAGLQIFGWILNANIGPLFTLSTNSDLANSILIFCNSVVACSIDIESLKSIDFSLRDTDSLEELISVCFLRTLILELA